MHKFEAGSILSPSDYAEEHRVYDEWLVLAAVVVLGAATLLFIISRLHG